MKILMLLVVFFLLGAFFIISNDDLHLSNGAEARQFVESYYSWAGNLVKNAGGIAGYVVKAEWLPSDATGQQVVSDASED